MTSSLESDRPAKQLGEESAGEVLSQPESRVMHLMRDAVLISDAKGIVRDANQAAYDLLGWSSDDLIGLDLTELWALAKVSGLTREDVESFVQGKGSWRGECSFIRRDSVEVAAEITAYPVSDNDGAEASGRIAVIRDISKRKAAEKALKESEQRISAILENVAEVVITIDESGRVLSVNRAFEQTFGYAADEIVGSDVSLVMPEPYRGQHPDYLDRYLVSGVSQILSKAPRELEAVDKNGRVFPIELMIGEAFIGDERVFIGSIRDIGDRRMATAALEESETRLRATMEGSLDGIYFHKAVRNDQGEIVDFEFVDVNDRALAMVGYSREDLIGSRLSEAYPGAFENGLFDKVKTILETGEPVDEEMFALEKVDAEWLHHQIVPYGDGVAFVVRDISERKRAEKELHETHARLQEAHRLARLADWSFDANTQCFTMYGSMFAELGFEGRPAVISLDEAFAAVFYKDVDRVREAFERAITDGTRYEDTYRVEAQDGRFLYLRLIGEAVRDSSDNIVGMRGTTQDVTSAMEVDRELKKAKDKLSLAQKISGIGTFDYSSTTGKVSASREFMRIFDRSSEGDRVMSIEQFYSHIYPDDLDRVKVMLRKSRDSGENFHSEYRIVSQSGVVKFVLGFGSRLLGEDGEFAGYTGTVQDITALKQTEQQLQQAQKMEAIGQLTGGIAHDFNNLLAIITGNLDLAIMRAGSNPGLVSFLETGIAASERGAELTRQMLAYSRRQTLVPQPTDINELTSNMLRLGERALGEAVDVIFEPSDEAWWAHVDPAQLESALLNLAINARDAMPDGGILAIRTRNLCIGESGADAPAGLPRGEYVAIEVTDTGTGMSEDICEKIFEPFFTTKEVGQGSGLGLSMVYGFAKRSGGHVDVKSAVSEGTSIYLYLPRAESARQDVVETEVDEVEWASLNETVLVVEDDPHVRELAISLVESLGYRVMHAGDPKTALEIIADGPKIDLLLSDVVLGADINGVELAKRVREKYPETRVLLMSGYAREALEKNGGLGGDKLIGKPFRRAVLAESISSVMH